MHILISIDDTDTLDCGGTGTVAQALAQELVRLGFGVCDRVTRHQLLLDPSIPYTSHNSAMCFTATIPADSLQHAILVCCAQVKRLSVTGSDPGLCVAAVELVAAPETLVTFGREAKRRVLTKDDAYAVAGSLGVHLSEHGGTGLGVIGALAGAGLRLTGNDGRFMGKFRIASCQGRATVREIREAGIDQVRSLGGEVLLRDDVVSVGDWVKPVLLDGLSVLLVVSSEDGEERWKACDRTVYQRY